MKQLLVATRSRGKQAEFRSMLSSTGLEILFPDDIGLRASPEEDGLEAFETFLENARAKATWFAQRSGLPTLADDSGLEVDALLGAPGVHSKRFAGFDGADHLVSEANNRELLKRLEGVAAGARTARYRCVLVLVDPEGDRELVAEGATEGAITMLARGDGGFGYDPLFLSGDLGVTFGEATPEQKHAVSHRGRALSAMVAALGAG